MINFWRDESGALKLDLCLGVSDLCVSGAAAGPAAGDGLLLESGDFLLLESGDFLLLE